MTERPLDSMGRPKRQKKQDLLDWDLFYKLLANNAKMADCEELLAMDKHTIHRAIKKKYGELETFESLRQKKLSSTRMMLQNTAIQMAKDKNVQMLQFALKNIAGWSDNPIVNEELDLEIEDEKNELFNLKL